MNESIAVARSGSEAGDHRLTSVLAVPGMGSDQCAGVIAMTANSLSVIGNWLLLKRIRLEVHKP